MNIGIIGYGVFGKAIETLIQENNNPVQVVDIGEVFSETQDVIFLTVPVQHMREALEQRKVSITDKTIVVNCSKGIELATGKLPQQIVFEVCGKVSYGCISGPSFSHEIMSHKHTVVNVASEDESVSETISSLLHTEYFVLESVGTVLELELAGAMKNIYAIAAGYIAGKGSGRNLHAHLQVVALREYVQLVTVLGGKTEVIKPGVVGDLILTTGSEESRNYQYGKALAQGHDTKELMAEGATSAEAIQALCDEHTCSLPLCSAVLALIQQKDGAQQLLFSALGFTLTT